MRTRTLARVFTAAAIAATAVAAVTLAGCDSSDPPIPATTLPAAAPTSPSSPTRAATAPAAAAPRPRIIDEVVKPDPTGPFKPDPYEGRIIQTVRGFNRPHSTAIGLDGKSFFVTNSAATIEGHPLNKGAVSRLELLPDGRLKMVNLKWVEGLHAPLGIAALPKDTKKFRAGTLFVATGSARGLDENGEPVTDIKKLNPGVTLIDPDSGKTVGFIPMGPGSAVAKSIFHPVLTPNGLTFDKDGNFYLADTGTGGRNLVPETIGRPGVIRIRHANLDAYADNVEQGSVSYVPVLHEPAPVFYSRFDNAIYWTTSDGKGDAGGAAYRIPIEEFGQKTAVNNILGGMELGPLLGVVITPVRNNPKAGGQSAGLNRTGGTFVASRLDGDVVFMNKIISRLTYVEDPSLPLSTPADIKLHTLPNGDNILYVPESEPNANHEWKQRLRVVLLPSSI